jgi:hypothetical protein
MDIMKIEILADGTIKIETDGISQVNHRSADEFLDEIEELTTKRSTSPKKISASMQYRSRDRKVTNRY